jgi:hypothetical protein
MSLRDLLRLENSVQIARETATADGYGGFTVTTALTTLESAAIWQAGTSARVLSDKIAAASTDVLVTEPTQYTWTTDDKYVVYGSRTYRIVGQPTDVFEYGEVTVVALERLL